MPNPKNHDNPPSDTLALKVGRRGPDKLLNSFSRTRFPLWLALSLLVHASIAGFVSYGFIRDNYIDPEGAAARKAAALAAEQAAQKPPAATGTTHAPGTPIAKSSAGTPAASTGTTDQLLEEHKKAPVVKRITEPAKPGEIPKQPGDLGISVDDTNLK